MGQYHKIYNKTKKEFIDPTKVNNNLKLFSQMSWVGGTPNLLMLLLSNSNGRGGGDMKSEACLEISGRWAGDEIVVQGDYAEADDAGFISEEEISEYTDIAESLLAAQQEILEIYED